MTKFMNLKKKKKTHVDYNMFIIILSSEKELQL